MKHDVEPYLNQLAKLFRENHELSRKSENSLDDYLDKAIVWLISLSAGSIALMLSNLDKIGFVLPNIIKLTICFLTISIIAGVLARICFIISIKIRNFLYDLYNFDLAMVEVPFSPTKLKGTETAEEIYSMMLCDFGLDFKKYIESKGIDAVINRNIDASARAFYIQYSEECRREVDVALEKLEEIIVEGLGFNKDQFNPKTVRSRAKRKQMNLSVSLGYSFFVICTLAFIASIFILIFNYYNH